MLDSTITGGATSASAPVTSLNSADPAEAVILTDASAAYLVFRLTAAQAVKVLAALYVGAEAATPTTWRWRGASTEAGLTTTPGYDSGTVAFASGQAGLPHRSLGVHDWLILSSAQTYQWWRVDFDTACSVGNVIIAPGFFPAYGAVYGAEMPSLVDDSPKRRGASGFVDTLLRPGYDRASFTLQFLSPAEALRTSRDIDEAVGAHKPVFVVMDLEETTYKQEISIYGLLDKSSATVCFNYNFYSRNYVVSELTP